MSEVSDSLCGINRQMDRSMGIWNLKPVIFLFLAINNTYLFFSFVAQICSLVCNRTDTFWSSPLLNERQVMDLTDVCISPGDLGIFALDILLNLENFAKSGQLFSQPLNRLVSSDLEGYHSLTHCHLLAVRSIAKKAKKGLLSVPV